jgi:hypothetical protein
MLAVNIKGRTTNESPAKRAGLDGGPWGVGGATLTKPPVTYTIATGLNVPKASN